MARAGYIGTQAALKKVFACVTTIEEARKLLRDALICGDLFPRGQPVKRCNQLADDSDELEENEEQLDLESEVRHLIELCSKPLELSAPGEMQDISSKFWGYVDFDDPPSCDWVEGRFQAWGHDIYSYKNVMLQEKSVNLLVAKHKSLVTGENYTVLESKKERRRQPKWDDWVAALAAISYEHQITKGMKQRDLLDRITARLATWGFEERPASTVGPTATTVLERFRTNPPTKPIEVLPLAKAGKKP